MAIPPQYDFQICGGTDPGSLVNVETLIADGRYFYVPVVIADTILRQPGADGIPFERGYQSFTWQMDLWRAQYSYLYNTVLGGRLQGRVVFRTLRVMDDSTYSTWRGILTLPDYSGFQRNFKLYQNVPLPFTRCLRVS